MKFISLFSGIGGFDKGFEDAGMECVAQVEQNEQCCAVLERHWPNKLRLRDVKDAGKYNLPAADLVCGGFPCQDLSVAGRRAGLAGERSGLWFEFHRIIEETRPRWVVIENVPGLLSSNAGRDFALILRGLVECGYGVCWRILDSQYFGVAQRRRRVYVVASLGNGRCAQVLFEREGMSGDFKTCREERTGTPTHSIRLAQTSNSGDAVAIDARNDRLQPHRISGTLQAKDKGSSLNYINPVLIAPTLNSSGAGTERPGGQGAEPEFYVVFQQNQRNEVRDLGEATGALSAERGMNNQNYVVTSGEKMFDATGYHREKVSDSVTPTLNEYDTPLTFPRNNPKTGVRRLTPTECERLQSFPDGWTFGSDSVRYKQLGNAVTVSVIHWLGQRILEADVRV